MTVAACSCGQKFRVRPEMAGKKAKCPKCGSVLQLPSAGAASATSTVQQAGGAAATATSTATAPDTIAACSCGAKFRVRPEMAGKKAKCPRCHTVMQLPGGPAPAPVAASESLDFSDDAPTDDDDFWSDVNATAEEQNSVAEEAAPPPTEEFGSHQALAFTVKHASAGRSREEIIRALKRRGIQRREAQRVVESVLGDGSKDDKPRGRFDLGWLWLSPDGRCSVLQYWVGFSALQVLHFLIFGLSFGLWALGAWFGFGTAAGWFVGIVYFGSLLLFFAPAIYHLEIKRLHDLGYSGWAIFLTLVPVVGQLFHCYISVCPGSDQPNEYGPPPT